jgi:hypothetical protein
MALRKLWKQQRNVRDKQLTQEKVQRSKLEHELSKVLLFRMLLFVTFPFPLHYPVSTR